MKRYQFGFIVRFLMICSLFGFGFSTITHADDDKKQMKKFSLADLKGRYAFAFDGSIPGVGPVVASGMFVADGKGNITDGNRSFNLSGTTLQQTFICTYTMNVNGTGSAECPLTSPTPGPAVETFDFTINKKGNLGWYISTNPGIVVLGRASR